MKILIVTAWYHPFIHPRAHRWTALAAYWAGQGHKVHVVSARQRNCPDEAVVDGVRVHRTGFDSLKEVLYYWLGIKNGRGRVGAGVQKPGSLSRLTAWLYNVVWKNVYFPDDACIWYFPARKKVRQLLGQEKFDVLVTVSLPFTGHLIGLSVASRLRNLEDFAKAKENAERTPVSSTPSIWLADIGDPFSIQAKPLNNSFLYGKYSRRLERRVLGRADVVTVTTEFTLQKYRREFGEAAVAKMHVVPPLLYPALPLPTPHSPLSTRHSLIRIGYFGALYAPVRRPDAFLDLLKQTFALRPDLKGRLEVHFYGEIFPEFYDRLAAEPSIHLHGLRSRDEVRRAMPEMDILLNIGNTTDFQLPSKAVDYLAAGRPIVNLSCTDDDPFAAFFKGNALILNVKASDTGVGEEEVRRWLEWLEGEKKLPGEAEIRERTEPYLVESVAARYFDLLRRCSASPMS